MKRIIAVLICIILLLTLMPLSAYAEETELSVYNYILENLKNFADTIDLRAYRPTVSEFAQVFYDLRDYEPYLFNVSHECQYVREGNYVVQMIPKYTMTAEEYAEALVFIDEKIYEIAKTLPRGLDDIEKALYFYDYICLNYCYDMTYESRTIYSILKENTGVCTSYTFLYNFLLGEVGIEAVPVVSDAISHMWSQIKINDNWYHVDVTWSDPVSSNEATDKGFFGRVYHEYFLCSDGYIAAAHETTDFVSQYPCNDVTYDDDSIKNLHYAVGFANGEVYSLQNDFITRLDVTNDTNERLYELDVDYYVSESGRVYYNNPYFGSCDNHLIYSNGESVIAFDPLARTVKTIVTPETEEQIVAIYTSENVLHYVIGSSTNTKLGTEYTLDIVLQIVGDIDNSGALTTLDYTRLKRAVMGALELNVSAYIWDINGDNQLGVADYTILKRAVMGTYDMK